MIARDLGCNFKSLDIKHSEDEVWVGVELGKVPAFDAKVMAGKPGAELPRIVLKDTYSELAGASSWIYSADEMMQTILGGGGRIRKFCVS